MENFAARMGEHEEDIEDAEGGGRNDQEIHGNQIFGVVLEESLPGLVAAPGSGAILTDGGIRDFDSEFGQFGLNAFAAPSGIAGPHLPNEVDELAIHGGSAAAGTGFPTPEQAKAQPMPGDDRLGLEEEQAFLAVRPEPPQGEPQ